MHLLILQFESSKSSNAGVLIKRHKTQIEGINDGVFR